jgi:hypothetical protein
MHEPLVPTWIKSSLMEYGRCRLVTGTEFGDEPCHFAPCLVGHRRDSEAWNSIEATYVDVVCTRVAWKGAGSQAYMS